MTEYNIIISSLITQSFKKLRFGMFFLLYEISQSAHQINQNHKTVRNSTALTAKQWTTLTRCFKYERENNKLPHDCSACNLETINYYMLVTIEMSYKKPRQFCIPSSFSGHWEEG